MDKSKVQKIGLLIMGFASGFVISGNMNRGEDFIGLLFPALILIAGVLLALAEPKK